MAINRKVMAYRRQNGRAIRLDDRPLGIAAVIEIDLGRETGAVGADQPAAGPIAEQLIHLPPHALEVGEQISLGHPVEDRATPLAE